jgi:class 3 adenylate cyclase
METRTSATPIKRRLTAILAADAVGFSRQMSENEESTLQVLAAQRAIIDRLIVAHEGRIFGTAGDSVLAEFASSVEAVRCAVEIQEALQTRNEGAPEAQRLEFRIGVNLGDVMVDGADILGDGVNVAARLESIADPGGICISSSVYDQILGKLSLGFVDLGESR